jgi:hypothetical protein
LAVSVGARSNAHPRTIVEVLVNEPTLKPSTWCEHMNVKVEVELSSHATEVHMEDMLASAKALTNNKQSVAVCVPDGEPKTIVAEFAINKARQVDVVDGIGRKFRCEVRNYSQSAISFPNAVSRKAQESRNQYKPKQGQYLAFIYYYTKLNGRPPAEADMQR